MYTVLAASSDGAGTLAPDDGQPGRAGPGGASQPGRRSRRSSVRARSEAARAGSNWAEEPRPAGAGDTNDQHPAVPQLGGRRGIERLMTCLMFAMSHVVDLSRLCAGFGRETIDLWPQQLLSSQAAEVPELGRSRPAGHSQRSPT